MKISTLLHHVHYGHLHLPHFAREYAWSPTQVSNLFKSLYRGHPVGSFIFWPNDAAVSTQPDSPQDRLGPADFIVDGHQRITAIYNVICARPAIFRRYRYVVWPLPPLHFHVHDQAFDFYKPSMQGDLLWINLVDFFNQDEGAAGAFLGPLYETPDGPARIGEYARRLHQLSGILDRNLAVEYLPSDASFEEAAEIHSLANGGYRPAE